MRYLVSILILLTGLSVSAELYRQKTEAPFLYAIQKEGKTSFILGSQHIGIQLNQLPEYVVDFIKRKKLLIGEVRIENSFVHITYHPEFKNDLPDSIREGLKRRGFSDFVIDHADQKEFCDLYFYWDEVKNNSYQNNSLDIAIQLLGRKLNKEFKVLDSNEKLMDDASIEFNDDCTLNSLEETIQLIPPETARTFMEDILSEMANDYLSGHEGSITRSEKNTTYLRNEHWMTELTQSFAEGYFAVVGAGHLAPDHPSGLISLYKKAGFTVTRVTAQNHKQFYK